MYLPEGMRCCCRPGSLGAKVVVCEDPPALPTAAGDAVPGLRPLLDTRTRAKALQRVELWGKGLLTHPASWKWECFKGGSVRAQNLPGTSEELPSALPAPPCEGWIAAWRRRRVGEAWEQHWLSRAGWCGRGWHRAAGVRSDGVVSRCDVQMWSSWGWVWVERVAPLHNPSTSYLFQILVHALCPHNLPLLPSFPSHSCTQSPWHPEITVSALLPQFSHITFDLMLESEHPPTPRMVSIATPQL